MSKLRCAVVVVTVTVTMGTTASADIINVPADFPTIQAAIDAAVDGDEIVVAPGTYFETINFLGKAITLRSSDGPDVTIIDAQGAGTVVTCETGEGSNTVLDGFTITGGIGTLDGAKATTIDAQSAGTVVMCGNGKGSNTALDGCTITGGKGLEGAGASLGGGMLNVNSSPTVTNCTFTGNTADSGGGMYNELSSSPTVTDCTFMGNVVTFFGAGIAVFDSDLTIDGCAFIGNIAEVRGGGIYLNGGTLTASNSTFEGNSTGVVAQHAGGAIMNTDSQAMLENCAFRDNESFFGGGIVSVKFFAVEASLTLIDCSLSGNFAVVGGGALNQDVNATVINCTFSGNTATNNGGGMHNLVFGSGTTTVTNCTFSGNTADEGGGMHNAGSSTSPTVTNCILWGDSPDEFSGSGTPTVTYSDVQGSFPGTGNIDADPLFVDPDNGDFRLLPGSPCIDAGDNTAVPEGIDTDLDGNPRFADDADTPDTGNGDSPIVDMGAYELQLPCPWDLNGDGVVNVLDLIELVMSFGPCEDCPTDLNDDGIVNVLDLIDLIMNFGPCPGTECVWDVNGDGVVDESDVQAVTSNLGPCEDPENCPWDVNGDGVVDGSDVQAVATHFGPCP